MVLLVVCFSLYIQLSASPNTTVLAMTLKVRLVHYLITYLVYLVAASPNILLSRSFILPFFLPSIYCSYSSSWCNIFLYAFRIWFLINFMTFSKTASYIFLYFSFCFPVYLHSLVSVSTFPCLSLSFFLSFSFPYWCPWPPKYFSLHMSVPVFISYSSPPLPPSHPLSLTASLVHYYFMTIRSRTGVLTH